MSIHQAVDMVAPVAKITEVDIAAQIDVIASAIVAKVIPAVALHS